jgi:putative transposase
LRLAYFVSLLCRVLEVTTSGYYAWVKRPLSIRQREEERLELEIRAAHKRTRQTYGPERLQRDLADNGVVVGVHRIKRIRRKLGLHCRQKRKFKATTDSRHFLPVAENLLDQKFEASAPNQIWLSDITYIPTGEGWLYLAGHKDLFTGEVVGYAMAERMTKNLVINSLTRRAVTAKRPAAGLIHHSDRGTQYCAQEYSSLLDRFGMWTSMSRKGNCYDNAPMESFWGVLKNEQIHHCQSSAIFLDTKRIFPYTPQTKYEPQNFIRTECSTTAGPGLDWPVAYRCVLAAQLAAARPADTHSVFPALAGL